MHIKDLIKAVHDWAVGKGWWDGGPRSIGDQFSNFHSELSEAWEEYRKHGMDSEKFIYVQDGKPEGLAVELADLVIRVVDTCGAYNIPLEEAIELKMKYNETRPYRHGNKKA